MHALTRVAHPVAMTTHDVPDAASARLAAIRAILERARAAGRTTLLEPEGLALLAEAGIAVPRWHARRSGAGRARIDVSQASSPTSRATGSS